jgi:ubiquinone biosynthesis protein UbiJ
VNKLEEMKIRAELAKVKASKAEMEYIVADRLDEIDRVKKNIEIQDKRILELCTKLGGDSNE